MTLPTGLDQVSWYGRGFQETYCDRKTGAKIGRYEAKVAELETPYMRPQENGNRVDVRSVEIRREDGSGLCFKALAGSVFEFSAHHYSLDVYKRQALWMRPDGCVSHRRVDEAGDGGMLSTGVARLHTGL